MRLQHYRKNQIAKALLLIFLLPLLLNTSVLTAMEVDIPIAEGADPWTVKQDEPELAVDSNVYYEKIDDLKAASVGEIEAISIDAVDAVIDGDVTQDAVVHEGLDSIEYRIDVPKAGSWHMALRYRVPGNSIQELIVDLFINDEIPYSEAQDISLPVAWENIEEDSKIDSYGNETYPPSRRINNSFYKTMKLEMFNLDEPLWFEFNEGENIIRIENNELSFELLEIVLFGEEEIPTYESYLEEVADHYDGTVTLSDSELIVIEGEKFSSKSHAHIRGERTKDVNYHPFDVKNTLINILAPTMWEQPGEQVTYKLVAPVDGFYRIGFRFTQGLKHEVPVFKNIEIDGEIPFQEFQSYAFPYTKDNISVHWLGESVDGEEQLLYLEEGEHELTLESTASLYFRPYAELLRVIQEMNLITLDIKMITGSKADENRDWSIEQYIPDIEDRLLAIVNALDGVYAALSDLAKQTDVSSWTDIRIIRDQIYRYTVDQGKDRGLDRLVNNLEVFSQGDGSLAEQLSLSLQAMLTQPMAIDQIYLAGADLSELPKSPNFFQSAILTIRKLMSTFTEYETQSLSIQKDQVNIWINRPVTYIDVLREMINQQYPDQDVEINLSAMPDENRLLLSVVAGEAPDGVLGVSTPKPYDFALRGAAYDLRNFDDFEDVTGSFTAEMMVPFAHEEGIYALPETAIFFVLFYRTDIMNRLSIEVPQTWDDLLNILPDLDRQGMNVQTMISATDAFKHFGTTVPFIQQFGGEIYADDGLSVDFDNPQTIEAFTLLTDLYIKYNLPNRIQNFYNNFKSGLTPIGVSDLNTYILLKNAAPEINGQWAIAPNLGMYTEDGTFVNTQPDITSAVMITEQSEKKDETWGFLKWWMSPEIQLQFGNELQLRFGQEYIWNTANLKALEAAPYFDREDRNIILEQVRTAREIPRHPAYFQVERELSNAWNTVVFDGTPVREALDGAALSSDRMIAIKLQEFGYLDAQGNVLKPLELADVEMIESYGNFISSRRMPGDMGYGFIEPTADTENDEGDN